MALHDKTLIFLNRVKLAASAGSKAEGKLVDLRLNGQNLDGTIFVNAVLKDEISSGSVTFKLEASADGTTWETLIEHTATAGAVLCADRLPLGTKRYLKASAEVASALAADTEVFAELTDTVDYEGPVTVQAWTADGPEDIAAEGDAVRQTVES